MCDFMSAMAGTQLALNIYGEYSSQKAMARADQSRMNQQKEAAIKNMAYLFQNYEQERRDAFEAAAADLDKTTRNMNETMSQVEAAINEGYSGGGRTADMLNRTVAGDLARATSSIKDNYARKSNEIDLNKESALIQTEDYLKGVNMSAPKMPSRFQNFLTSAGMAIESYTGYRNAYENKKNATYNHSDANVNSPTTTKNNYKYNSFLDWNTNYDPKWSSVAGKPISTKNYKAMRWR